MAKLAMLGFNVRTADLRIAIPEDKQAAPHYMTKEHREWRLVVCRRAKWHCEKCRAPGWIADHIVEIKDDPTLSLDIKNGQCLCPSCHTLKTNVERDRRNS